MACDRVICAFGRRTLEIAVRGKLGLTRGQPVVENPDEAERTAPIVGLEWRTGAIPYVQGHVCLGPMQGLHKKRTC